MNNAVQFAEPGSKGALASKIGWINFGEDINLVPSKKVIIKNRLPGGYNIEFELSLISRYISNPPIIFNAFKTPVLKDELVAFGNYFYTGIKGNVALYMIEGTPKGINTFIVLTLDNILVTNLYGDLIKDYTIIVADAEVTTDVETWSVTTDGSLWKEINNDGEFSEASGIQDIGTDIIRKIGINDYNISTFGVVYETKAPRKIICTCTTNGTKEGFVYGVIVNEKNNLNIIYDKVKLEMPPKDMTMYVCPQKIQYIEIELLSNCELFIINYLGEGKKHLEFNNSVIEGKLANYTIRDSGIIISPHNFLRPSEFDILTFELVNKCGIHKFDIIFRYPVMLCCKI